MSGVLLIFLKLIALGVVLYLVKLAVRVWKDNFRGSR